jgi:hypothetical protein
MTIAKRSKWLGRTLGAAGVLALGLTLPAAAHAGKALKRLSASVTAIDGNAILLPYTSTPGAVDNVAVFQQTLKIPSGTNVVYVTISGTGISDESDDGTALNCQVDGVNCLNGEGTPGPGSVAAIPPGWVIPLGSEYWNTGVGLTGFNYQWCAPITKGTHTITIYGASAFGYGDQYLEAVQVFVDANKIGSGGSACGTYSTPNPSLSPD